VWVSVCVCVCVCVLCVYVCACVCTCVCVCLHMRGANCMSVYSQLLLDNFKSYAFFSMVTHCRHFANLIPCAIPGEAL
jgi:hypothetical protein